MSFSKYRIVWYKFRIGSSKNMAQKYFDKSSSEQQNGVSNERSNFFNR